MPGTADTFTASNRLDKQAVGGNYNLWGVYLNDNFDLIDDLKDGNLILTMSTTQHTLTTNTGAADQARMASITVIGTPGGTGTITAPNVEKLTWVENLLTGGYPIVWTNGTGTSCTIQNAAVAQVQCDFAGNMKILGGSQFGNRVLKNIAAGTNTDDAVRVDQVGTLAVGIPTGGTSGQVIRKNSSTNGDASWVTATALGSNGLLTQGYESIFIPAKSFTPITTNGGTQTTMSCTTSSRMLEALVLGVSTAQYASFTIDGMPKSWDGGSILVSFRGFTTGNSGQVWVMNVGLCQLYNGITVDQSFNFSTDALGTEAGTASFVTVSGTITASISGGTASNMAGLGIMIRRNTTSASQSLAGNLFLTGVNVRYNNNLPNDT